jgi:GTPase SAR1 family protein
MYEDFKNQRLTQVYKFQLLIALKLLERVTYDHRNTVARFVFSLLDQNDLPGIASHFPDFKEIDRGRLIELTEESATKRKIYGLIGKIFTRRIQEEFKEECLESSALNHLQDIFGHTDIEKDLLLILYLFQSSGSEFGYELLGRFDYDVCDLIASILNRSSAEIRGLVNYRGNLQKAGILRRAGDRLKLSPLFADFIGYSLPSESIWDRILEEISIEEINPEIGQSHISKQELDVLERMILAPFPKALLFSGPPGVGKTSLALKLGKRLGLRVYKLRDWDHEGENSLEFRRSCIAALMAAKPDPKMLVLIDEAEGVLSTQGLFHSKDMDLKAWVNATIERLPLNTIFALNTKKFICESTIRRMAFTLTFSPQKRMDREVIIKETMEKNGFDVDQEAIRSLSSYSLSAADVIQGIVQVKRMELSSEEAKKVLMIIYTNKLKAYGLFKENQLGLGPLQ